MAKPTRRQRQEMKHSKKSTFRRFIMAGTIAAGVLLIASTAVAAEPTPMPEPAPVLVVTPPAEVVSNDQCEQLAMMEASSQGRAPEEIQAAIIEMDQARSLDHRFRDHLNQRWLSEEDVLSALYYVTFAQFLQRYGRIAPVRSDLRMIGSVFLTDVRGWQASSAGEELWSRFRYRMRRESALVRICENKILPNNSASGPRLRIASRAA